MRRYLFLLVLVFAVTAVAGGFRKITMYFNESNPQAFGLVVEEDDDNSAITIDTIFLPPLMLSDFVCDGMYARFVLASNYNTLGGGAGNADSTYMQLYTIFGNDVWVELGRDSVATAPCTLSVKIGSDTTGGSVDTDTLFHEGLALVITVSDTVSDTSGTVYYPIKVDMELKDR